MRPTEALFDAVNRGDIAAARDALGRGADIDGRNILGLTSLELAVDLGRNDITFLLLSMRGAAGSSSMAPPPPAARAPAAPAPARVAAAPAQPAPQRARAANADPGTPVPQAGFLGFGAPSR
jgi:ankyrin repeat protein